MATRLDAWMIETRTRGRSLSEQTGITQARISHLRHGYRTASVGEALLLEAATAGRVPVASWLDAVTCDRVAALAGMGVQSSSARQQEGAA